MPKYIAACADRINDTNDISLPNFLEFRPFLSISHFMRVCRPWIAQNSNENLSIPGRYAHRNSFLQNDGGKLFVRMQLLRFDFPVNCHFAVCRSHNNPGTIEGRILNTNVCCCFFCSLSNSGSQPFVVLVLRKSKEKNQLIRSVSFVRSYFINIIMSIFSPSFHFLHHRICLYVCTAGYSIVLVYLGASTSHTAAHDCSQSFSASHFIYAS